MHAKRLLDIASRIHCPNSEGGKYAAGIKAEIEAIANEMNEKIAFHDCASTDESAIVVSVGPNPLTPSQRGQLTSFLNSDPVLRTRIDSIVWQELTPKAGES